MEAGLYISTAALHIVSGDENGTQWLGYNWATIFLGGGYKYGYLALKVAGVSHETENCDHELCGTRARGSITWQSLELLAEVNFRPILSSERAHYRKKPATV
jgi:hypothetical protein